MKSWAQRGYEPGRPPVTLVGRVMAIVGLWILFRVEIHKPAGNTRESEQHRKHLIPLSSFKGSVTFHASVCIYTVEIERITRCL